MWDGHANGSAAEQGATDRVRDISKVAKQLWKKMRLHGLLCGGSGQHAATMDGSSRMTVRLIIVIFSKTEGYGLNPWHRPNGKTVVVDAIMQLVVAGWGSMQQRWMAAVGWQRCGNEVRRYVGWQRLNVILLSCSPG